MMSQSSNRFGLLEVLKKASIRKVKRFFFSIMSSFWSFYFIIYLTWVPLKQNKQTFPLWIGESIAANLAMEQQLRALTSLSCRISHTPVFHAILKMLLLISELVKVDFPLNLELHFMEYYFPLKFITDSKTSQ